MIDSTFHRLWVVGVSPRRRQKERLWRCLCSCDGVVDATARELRKGRVVSCGCKNADDRFFRNHIHGLTKRDERRPDGYFIWVAMKQRCLNPKNLRYPSYGGRGITVCDRWRDSFLSFVADMGPRPSRRHSVDRINNNGAYCPENCRWATAKQQAGNRRPPRKRRAAP